MTATYLEWIDRKIEEYEREVARLTIARTVIVEAAAAIKPTSTAPKQLAKPKRGGKQIKGQTRQWIIAAMKTMTLPATSGAITGVVQREHPEITEKAIWNALYNARLVGQVGRDSRGQYSLPTVPDDRLGSVDHMPDNNEGEV